MKLKLKYTGAFVTIFLILAFLVTILSLLFISIDKKYFAKKIIYFTKFDDARGLSTSTPVYFKGYFIGQVNEFTLNDENMVEVELNIFEEYKNKIIENSAFYKVINPLTNSSSIEYLIGDDFTKIVPESSYVPSVDTPEGKLLIVQNKVKKSGEVLASVLENLNLLLTNLNRTDSLEDGVFYTATLSAASTNQAMKKMAYDMSAAFDMISNDLNRKDGNFNKAFHSFSELSEQLMVTSHFLDKTLQNADTLFMNYKNPEGLAARMIDPTGEQVFAPMNKTLEEVNTLLAEHSKFMVFLNTQSSEITFVLEGLKATLKEFQKTLEGLNNNPVLRYGISPEEKKGSNNNMIRKNLD